MHRSRSAVAFIAAFIAGAGVAYGVFVEDVFPSLVAAVALGFLYVNVQKMDGHQS